MLYEVVTHPEAFAELQEALDWLDERSLWAGKNLSREYDEHISMICEAPASFRKIHSNYRRANLHRFSYHIIYRIRQDYLFVIAFVHDKRHPDYWKARITDDQD